MTHLAMLVVDDEGSPAAGVTTSPMRSTGRHRRSTTESRRGDSKRRVEERDAEHRVTPLELFFDLVFVFAFTQVMSLFVDDPTRVGCSAGCWFSLRSGGRGSCTRARGSRAIRPTCGVVRAKVRLVDEAKVAGRRETSAGRSRILIVRRLARASALHHRPLQGDRWALRPPSPPGSKQ
jgi:Bacterial low temperature requirement A protein (LtrA)